jgi:hypothetical protein
MQWTPCWLALVCSSVAFAQGLPSKEALTYSVEWRLITAGKARVDWNANSDPRTGWTARLHLESTGLVSKLFKVEDDYTSTLNPALCAETLQITSHEGSRVRETKVTFDAATKKANYLERDRVKNTVVLAQETDIPACVHDVIGGLYYFRTLNLEPGQSTQVAVSDGKKSVMARVEAQQREEIKTPAGTFKTIRYEIYLFNNVLYRRPAHLYIWMTDDRRKLPVQLRVRMTITIGTITLLLEKQE